MIDKRKMLGTIPEAIRQQMNELAPMIEGKVPGMGFTLLVFPLNKVGAMSYISNALRADMLKALQEFIDAHKQSPVDGVIGEPSHPLYGAVVAFVRREGRVSTSQLQREFLLDYAGASELLGLLEVYGIVSAPNAVGKREIMKVS